MTKKRAKKAAKKAPRAPAKRWKPRLRARLTSVEEAIDRITDAMLAEGGPREDAASMTQALKLAGLNALRWNLLGQQAEFEKDLGAAAKCAVQEQKWAQQKARDAKLLKVDLLREIKARIEAQERGIRAVGKLRELAHEGK